MNRPARLAAAGIGLILLVNLALFAAAASNRRGVPLSELALTERELMLPVDRQEPSASIVLSLRLATRAPDLLRRAARTRRVTLPELKLDWFDRDKLRELGFSVDVDPDAPDAARHYLSAQFKRAWVVLEYDGEAWTRWISSRTDELERLRRASDPGEADAGNLADAEALLAFDRVARSRLVPVDAGLDAAELQRRYSDGERFAVLPALVRPELEAPENGPPVLGGRVQGLLVSWIFVPRRQRDLLEPLMPTEASATRWAREREQARAGWPEPVPPRYRATLAVGRGHSPWLVSVDTPGTTSSP